MTTILEKKNIMAFVLNEGTVVAEKLAESPEKFIVKRPMIFGYVQEDEHSDDRPHIALDKYLYFVEGDVVTLYKNNVMASFTPVNDLINIYVEFYNSSKDRKNPTLVSASNRQLLEESGNVLN
jgi:hypothetical protein